MTHKNRNEQIQARKDPKKLARVTKRHRPKVDYQRNPRDNREIDDQIEEYYEQNAG